MEAPERRADVCAVTWSPPSLAERKPLGSSRAYETGRPVGQLQVRLPGGHRFHGYDVDELAVR